MQQARLADRDGDSGADENDEPLCHSNAEERVCCRDHDLDDELVCLSKGDELVCYR